MVRRYLLAAGSLLAIIPCSPVLAAEADQPPPPAAPDAAAQTANSPSAPATSDVPIIVTAQRREQLLTKVPVAITAYNGKFLDQLGINDFEQLSRFVPGFEVQNQSPNNPAIVLRGITSDTGEAFAEPRITIFQDGVSLSRTRGAYVELFDMERVEVVKGPQSTLYGRGALIGAVNLVENKANPSRFEAYAEGDIGNYNFWGVEGMVNAPLDDDAAVRVAGRFRKRDGFVDNLLGGKDFNSLKTGAIRGAARVDPSSRIRIDLIGNYQEDHPSGTSFKSIAYNPTDPVTGEVLGNRKFWTGAALEPGAGFENGKDLGIDRKLWSLTGLVRADLSDALTLNSVTGYRKFHSLEVLDIDGISLPVITGAEDAKGKQFSEELRLNWNNRGPLEGFLGASYFHEDGSQAQPVQFDERTVLAQLTGTLNGGPFLGRPATDPAPLAFFSNTAFTSALLQAAAAAQGVALNPLIAQGIAANLQPAHGETATNSARTNSIDVFADATWHVTDRIDLGAGARYSHDNKRSGIEASVLNGRSILGGFIGALGQPEPLRTALLSALAVPGAATIPPSAGFPVPLFGLTFQPTANNGDRFTANLTDHGFTWRLNGRYEIDPNTEAYVTYSRGRRPEVLSALPPTVPFGAARFDEVPAETVDNYEIGARHQTGRLLLDGDVFYYRYKNFQTVQQVGTLFTVANAGKADNYGFEGQVRWRASPNVELFGNYTYNNGRFQSGAFKGNHFRQSPDHKFALGGIFSARVGPGSVDFTPSLTYQSKIFFDDDNDRPELQTLASGKLVPDLVQDEFQGGYALVNARLGYTFAQRYRVEAFVNNLLDKKYLRDAGNTGDALGMPTFIAGERRTFGAQLSARF